MSEERKSRLGEVAGKLGGLRKGVIKAKATEVIVGAAKPITDSVKDKVDEATSSVKEAAEKKAAEIVKEQVKNKILGR